MDRAELASNMIEEAIKDSYPELSARVREGACNLKGFTLEYCIRIFLEDLIRKGWAIEGPSETNC